MADKAHIWTDEKLEKMERHLSAVFSKAEKELQEKSDAYFLKFAKQDEEKRKLYEKGEITKKEYQNWRKGKLMYGKRFKEMREQCAEQLLDINKTAISYINGQLPEVYTRNYNQLETAVSGIKDYSFTLIEAETVKHLASTDKSLLPYKKLNPAKDKKWNMQKINSETLQGILQGESVRDISKRILNVQEMNKHSAIRTARTIVTGAENKGRIDSYARAEADGIIIERTWLATNDGRVRHSHSLINGETRPVNEPFSNGLMYPADPNGRPEEVYNCRCTLTAKVIGFRSVKK